MTSRGSSSGSHRPTPLEELLKRDVNVKVEKPDVLFGQASQSRKGEDFTFIETDCQRTTGDADTSFSVFTLDVQKIRWMVRRFFLLMANDEGDDSDDRCRFSKDALTMKSSKRSPLMLKMIALTFVMICGIYVSSISLKQLGFHPQSIFPVEVTKDSCPIPTVSQSELHPLHYPDPVSYRREECSCTPVGLFAILSMQRSGSGWFETLLNSHTNISSNGEIFSNKDRRSNITLITNTLDKVYNLDWLSSAAKNECTAAVGLKWMLNQGLLKNHEEIVAYFNRRSVSAIFLFRRNLLRRMVSVLANLHDRDAKLLNGTHRSHVHSKNEAVILAKHKPFVNTSLLVPELKRTEKMAADAVNYFKSTRHIILFYEDIIRNQTKLMDVLEFLSVPQRKLVSLQVKIHTRPLADQIDNWDSVYEKLKGTEYETFLNADYQL